MVALAALSAVVSAVASVALIAFAYRRNRRNHVRTELARQCFSGQPQAVVHLTTWGLPVTDVRRVAGQHGYAEAQAPTPAVLVFHLAQGSQGAAPSAPGVPGAGGGPPHTPTIGPREQRRLSQRLAHKEFAWVDIADSGGTPADIAALAHQYGAQILRTYGDRAQPVLLLGKRPIHSVRDIAAGSRGLRSWTTHWLSGGVMLGAAILFGVVSTAAQDGLGSLTWPVVGLCALVILAGLAINIVPPLRDTTTRMNRLIREFDGRVQLTIIAQHYRFSVYTYLDVAAELGYQEANSMRDWLTSSRWHRSWLKFVRR